MDLPNALLDGYLDDLTQEVLNQEDLDLSLLNNPTRSGFFLDNQQSTVPLLPVSDGKPSNLTTVRDEELFEVIEKRASDGFSSAALATAAHQNPEKTEKKHSSRPRRKSPIKSFERRTKNEIYDGDKDGDTQRTSPPLLLPLPYNQTSLTLAPIAAFKDSENRRSVVASHPGPLAREEDFPASNFSGNDDEAYGNDDEIDDGDEEKIEDDEDNYDDTTRHINRGYRKEFPCNIDGCGKIFTRNSNLTAHLKTHTRVKPHTCDICGKSFTRNTDLKRHKMKHTGEKSFECDDCGKSFARNTDLKRHQITHTDERPFKCDKCEKSFTRNYHLTSHMGTHTGGNPYPCDICGKSFTRNRDLKRHTMTHTGEKPHTCDICGKSFAQNCNLNIHKKKLHKDF